MLVEGGPRGYSGAEHDDLVAVTTRHLRAALTALRP
jgi:hypothetical protein